jgi:hypothetical protein
LGFAGPAPRKGGTYSRFEEDVKRDVTGSEGPARSSRIWGFS